MAGWIKLYRQITNSSKFADPDILRLWILCLTKASHKDSTATIDKQEIKLLAGQFITGRFSLAEDYNASLSPRKKIKDTTLWSWLKRLEEWGDIDINSTNKYSIVSVVKWVEYQETLTTEPQQIDNRLTTELQQIDTNKNVKKEKNDKKVKEEVIKEYTENTVELTNHLIDLMQMNNPNVKIPTNLDKWNHEMELLERLDKYDYMQIRSVIDWCQQDSFWKGNILSAPKLREKIATLLMQMQRPKAGASGNGKVSSFTRLQQMAREENEREASGGY